MIRVARVHYEIPDELHRKAKAAAAMQGVTLREFIIRALQNAVKTEPRTGQSTD